VPFRPRQQSRFTLVIIPAGGRIHLGEHCLVPTTRFSGRPCDPLLAVFLGVQCESHAEAVLVILH
jgi:hypothetical protein